MNSRFLLEKLEDNGILMLSDPHLPSVVRLVGGPEVKGSWWGHPRGHEIFRQLKMLESDPDSLVTRLVSSKVTYLHRSVWPDFLTVATAREAWQYRGLSRLAIRLLRRVEKEGEVRTDRILGTSALGAPAREIERRLLAYSEEVHTERGAHAKLLMTWSRCPKVRDLRIRPGEPQAARNALLSLMNRLNQRYKGNGKLPWQQE